MIGSFVVAAERKDWETWIKRFEFDPRLFPHVTYTQPFRDARKPLIVVLTGAYWQAQVWPKIKCMPGLIFMLERIGQGSYVIPDCMEVA